MTTLDIRGVTALPAGRNSREAAQGVAGLPDRLSRDQRAAADGLLGALRGELRRALDVWRSEETTALARLDTRLAAVEG